MAFGFRRSASVFVALVASGTLPAVARGEPSTSDRAIAERLFEQAKEQLRANRVSAACESFAESQRLDPGSGTLLNLAACHEQEGKLASSWVEFREALPAIRRENRPDRLSFALDHLAVIEPKLAYLTLMVPELPGGPAPTIRLDGRDLGPAAWNVPIPVDEGWHEAVAQAPGGGPWRATIRIHNGDHRVLSLPTQVAADGVAVRDDGAPEPHPPAVSASPAADRRQDVSASSPSRARLAVAAVLGGAGLVSLGVGTYAAVHAARLWRDRNQACQGDRCTTEGLRLGDRASTSATVATWTLGGGALAAAVAAGLWLWPSRDASANGTSTPTTTPIATLTVAAGWGVALEGAF